MTFLTKQYNLGIKFGGFRILVANVMFYVAMVNFLLISVTAYSTTLRDPIRLYLPWFNFPIFAGIMVIFFIVGAVIEHKFVIPAVTRYSNSQIAKHENPIMQNTVQILARLEKIEEAIENNKK